MEWTLLEVLSNLGIGAVFGLVMFYIYRLDRKDSERRLREDKKESEARLTSLLETDQQSRHENTKALTELTMLISRLINVRH